MKKLLTRQMYMNRECTHREYYSQIAAETNAKSIVLSNFGENAQEKLKDLIEKDEYLNSYPLKYWDAMGCYLSGAREAVRRRGDGLSKACIVCILKAAARDIVEGK